MIRSRVVTISLLLAAGIGSADARPCLETDSRAAIEGSISRETFPGPPNYEDTATGNSPDTYWILTLKDPICVAGREKSKDPLSRVQLVLAPEGYKRFAPLLGTPVRATGSLFEAVSGHHKTSMLLQVERIERLAAATSESVESNDCYARASHVEQRECLESASTESDRALTAAEDTIRQRITKWDEQPDYKSASRGAFDSAAAAFRTYRSRQCDFAATTAAGGNGAGDLRLACEIDLNQLRVQRLKEQGGFTPAP